MKEKETGSAKVAERPKIRAMTVTSICGNTQYFRAVCVRGQHSFVNYRCIFSLKRPLKGELLFFYDIVVMHIKPFVKASCCLICYEFALFITHTCFGEAYGTQGDRSIEECSYLHVRFRFSLRCFH